MIPDCPSDRGREECVYVPGVGFEPELPGPRRNLIRIYANAVAYALILFLLMQNVTPRLLVLVLRPMYPALRIYNDSFLASRELIERINIASSLLCYPFPLFTLAAVLRMPVRRAFPVPRVSMGTVLSAVGITLGSSALGSGCSVLLSSILARGGLVPSGPDIPAADSMGLLVLTIFSTALIPAIFEELLFRGVILQGLRRFGDLFALTASTVLFGLLHRNLVQLPNALMTGAVLAFLMLRTGSLWVVITCHFINNLIPVILQSAAGAFPVLGGDAAFFIMTGCYLAVGLLGLIGFGLLQPGGLSRIRGEGRCAEGKKYRSFFSSLPMLALVGLLCVMILWDLF